MKGLPHLLLFVVLALLKARGLLVVASDCPLDFSWSNFTSVASICSNQSQIGKCCRYMNAMIAVSVANYATGTGQLGVSAAISNMCIDSISEIFVTNGVPANATVFCGLGVKIVANYQCKGRSTILEMLQAPNFTNVVKSCMVPLSADISCRKCINAAIIYLHHLIDADDTVTLSTCRNAGFVTLASQDTSMSPADMASCFFSVRNIVLFTVNNISGAVPPSSMSEASPGPGPAFSENPAHQLSDISIRENHHPHQLRLIQDIGIGITGIALLLLILLVLLIRKKSKQLDSTHSHVEKTPQDIHSQGRNYQEGQLPMFRRFTYKETKKATSNFSSIIGRGGFGTVYKARFCGGFVAAVKRMNKAPSQGEDEFCKEVDLLGRLHHRHLVALKGFCSEKHERFLMYEYMENGSLRDHLHSPGRTSLSWQARMQIAIDVANALEYLHFYCDPPLCHRDIKSSNILLDENFVAKVADFGLAHASRIGSINFEPVNTDIRGTPVEEDPSCALVAQNRTCDNAPSPSDWIVDGGATDHVTGNLCWISQYKLGSGKETITIADGSTVKVAGKGYMDPEYVVTQELTEKSDVYSYGVLLLELVTGREAVQDKKNLVEWSQKFIESDFRLPELVDPLIANSFDVEQLKVVVEIAQWCTQVEGKARPSIKQVLRMLYEGLDPMQRGFMEAIGDNEDDEDGGYGGLKGNKGKSQLNAIIPYSGDGRCLMSSSSTSRSYCSRSLLLESGSPQSPPGTFSV